MNSVGIKKYTISRTYFFYGRHHDVLVEYLKITKNTLASSTTSFII